MSDGSSRCALHLSGSPKFVPKVARLRTPAAQQSSQCWVGVPPAPAELTTAVRYEKRPARHPSARPAARGRGDEGASIRAARPPPGRTALAGHAGVAPGRLRKAPAPGGNLGARGGEAAGGALRKLQRDGPAGAHRAETGPVTPGHLLEWRAARRGATTVGYCRASGAEAETER